MRLTSLAIAACLSCDSGASQTVVAAPPGASPAAVANREVVSTAPASAAPSSPTPGTSPQSGASEPRFEGQPGCRFQRPEIWAGGQVTWLGDCQKGFAEGAGVIVNVVEGAPPERFYGHLDSGSPSLGVLQTESGFVAGRWNHGTVAAADDRRPRESGWPCPSRFSV
jgi:hypothetical protein